MSGRTARAGRWRDDRGFTLVELLVSVVILGAVALPLGQAIIGFLKESDSTAAWLAESHDAQISSAYFAQDVRSIGVRAGFTSTATPALQQSVELNAPPTSGVGPCGPATTPNAALRLSWDDYPSWPSTSPSRTSVAYVVVGSTLHRLRCEGGALKSDATVAHGLVTSPSTPAVTVTCAGTTTSCTGSGNDVPTRISLTLTLHDADRRGGADYTVTLTGTRRQS